MIISRNRAGKSLGGGILLGIVICLGLGIFHFLEGPSVAGAAMIDPTKDLITAKPRPRTLQGIAIMFSYPESFDLVSRLNTDKTALEQYNLGNSRKVQQTIAVSVRPLPTGLLNDDSSWRIRVQDSAQYASNKEILQNEPVAVMTKIDKTEKTLFWVHQGKLLIIAITTNDPNDDLAAMLASIKPTIRWRT